MELDMGRERFRWIWSWEAQGRAMRCARGTTSASPRLRVGLKAAHRRRVATGGEASRGIRTSIASVRALPVCLGEEEGSRGDAEARRGREMEWDMGREWCRWFLG